MNISEIISAISTINSITGISLITLLTIMIQLFSKHLTIRKFLFSGKTIRNCVWEYIEPEYEFNGEIQQGHIAKKLKQIIYKLNGCKMVIVLGDSGLGKTSLVNRFIWKYDRYFWLKSKSVVKISGLACQSILEAIDSVENKENTILIIDGLEEAYLYESGDSRELTELNKKLVPFYGVLVTVNEAFYRQNIAYFKKLYYRNADQEKISPVIVRLRPFSDKIIQKYIHRSIRADYGKKRKYIDIALKNIDIFSSPLMLSFIPCFGSYKGQYTSQLEIRHHILLSSLKWEKKKISVDDNVKYVEYESYRIMNRICLSYLNGKLPVYKGKEVTHNILLEYDKRKQEYRFRNSLF